jgi:hypothetical protein
MFWIGLLCGFILGAFLTLVFLWKFFTEANVCYEEGRARWEKGTEEYRKALSSLEIMRAEKESQTRRFKDCWEKLRETLQQQGFDVGEVMRYDM